MPNCKIKILDRRNNKTLLQQFDNGAGKSQNKIATAPEVSSNPEVMDFCKAECAAFASELGFVCHHDKPAQFTLDIEILQFAVGYYSGKGWAGNVRLAFRLKKQGEEFYESPMIKEEKTFDVSSTQYSAMADVINVAWNNILVKSKEEWMNMADEMRSTMQQPEQPVSGTQPQAPQVVYVSVPATQPSPQVEAVSPTGQPERKLSDVDEDIPVTNANSDNTIVLIIANENYQDLQKVNYARNDGETFKEYCRKTLNVPEEQILTYYDVTFMGMEKAFSKLEQLLKASPGMRAIVYYCGHGTNDEATGAGFLVPTDGDGKSAKWGYDLNALYQKMAATQASSITYFIDACFSGAGRSGDMLVAARGTARAPKKATLEGNTIVFSATSASETAMAYEEKQHGLFTYYLLKKLKETHGNVTYGELSSYISQNVTKKALLVNDKPQTPTTATSPDAVNGWEAMKLK